MSCQAIITTILVYWVFAASSSFGVSVHAETSREVRSPLTTPSDQSSQVGRTRSIVVSPACQPLDLDSFIQDFNRRFPATDYYSAVNDAFRFAKKAPKSTDKAAGVYQYTSLVDRVTTKALYDLFSSPDTKLFLGAYTDGKVGKDGLTGLRVIYQKRTPGKQTIKAIATFQLVPPGKFAFQQGYDSLRVWIKDESNPRAPILGLSYSVVANGRNTTLIEPSPASDGIGMPLKPPVGKPQVHPLGCVGCHSNLFPRGRSAGYAHFVDLEGKERLPDFADQWKESYLKLLQDPSSGYLKLRKDLIDRQLPQKIVDRLDAGIKEFPKRTFQLPYLLPALEARCKSMAVGQIANSNPEAPPSTSNKQ